MKIEISNRTSLQTTDLPGHVLDRLKSRLSFPNPAWEEANKRGFSTWNIPEVIWGYEQLTDRLVIPRGATRQTIGILKNAGVPIELDDQRRLLPGVDFEFKGSLRDYQAVAVKAMLQRDFGVLAAPTGSGKTIMALSMVATRRQPALIVVHTKELLQQWVDRIGQYLGIPADQVGVICGGKLKVGAKITVGLVQSLYKCVPEVAAQIGYLVVDECHRAPSRTFSEVVSAFDCRYMTGLSATPFRRDKLTRLIYWHLGDKVHEIDRQQLEANGSILKAEVIWRETQFQPYHDPSSQYSKMLSELCQDEARNAQIVQDITAETQSNDGVCLVLSDRKSHCKTLTDLLSRQGIEAAMLTGDLTTKARQKVVEAMNRGSIKVVAATGALIGEGFDLPALSVLFMTTPVKFSGRVLQYLGRVLRPAPNKTGAKVLDYLDKNVGVLQYAARGRQKFYEGRV